MIKESVVCLDRRVVNPPAVEAGGGTTWTLPYPVAVDGSAGTVRVVRLDTAVELAVTRPSPTTVRATGSFSAAPVAIGVSFGWRFTPTTIYLKGYDGKPDRRAAVRLALVRFFLNGARELTGTVTVDGRTPRTVQLSTSAPEEGQQFTLHAHSDSRRARLLLSSDSPWPVRIGSLEWEGQCDPISTTQVPQ